MTRCVGIFLMMFICLGMLNLNGFFMRQTEAKDETTTVATSKIAASIKEETAKITTEEVTATKETSTEVATSKSAKVEKTTVKSKSKQNLKPKPNYDINANLSNMHYSSVEFLSIGRRKDNSGYTFTYYSETVLPGDGLVIPGRHLNYEGYVCDKWGFICLASPDLSKGTVVKIPFGDGLGKIYDDGCDSGIIDVYLNSEYIYENFSL